MVRLTELKRSGLESGGVRVGRDITCRECVPFHSQPQHKAHVRRASVCHFSLCEGFDHQNKEKGKQYMLFDILCGCNMDSWELFDTISIH